MRRATALTAGGLVATVAAVLLLRAEREGGHASSPTGDLRSAAIGNAASNREAHAVRPLRTPRTGPAEPAIRSDGQSWGASGALPADESVRDSPVTAFLASHSSDELALFARFERLTGRGAPPALIALVERRRAGAPSAELVALATRLFSGDPLGRAAALEWLRDAPQR
jgi:hypothetical protein